MRRMLTDVTVLSTARTTRSACIRRLRVSATSWAGAPAPRSPPPQSPRTGRRHSRLRSTLARLSRVRVWTRHTARHCVARVVAFLSPGPVQCRHNSTATCASRPALFTRHRHAHIATAIIATAGIYSRSTSRSTLVDTTCISTLVRHPATSSPSTTSSTLFLFVAQFVVSVAFVLGAHILKPSLFIALFIALATILVLITTVFFFFFILDVVLDAVARVGTTIFRHTEPRLLFLLLLLFVVRRSQGRWRRKRVKGACTDGAEACTCPAHCASKARKHDAMAVGCAWRGRLIGPIAQVAAHSCAAAARSSA